MAIKIEQAILRYGHDSQRRLNITVEEQPNGTFQIRREIHHFPLKGNKSTLDLFLAKDKEDLAETVKQFTTELYL